MHYFSATEVTESVEAETKTNHSSLELLKLCLQNSKFYIYYLFKCCLLSINSNLFSEKASNVPENGTNVSEETGKHSNRISNLNLVNSHFHSFALLNIEAMEIETGTNHSSPELFNLCFQNSKFYIHYLFKSCLLSINSNFFSENNSNMPQNGTKTSDSLTFSDVNHGDFPWTPID